MKNVMFCMVTIVISTVTEKKKDIIKMNAYDYRCCIITKVGLFIVGNNNLLLSVI